MKNQELIKILSTYPLDMPIKLLLNVNDAKSKPIDFAEENILHTSETAFVNEDAHEDEWDAEDGKVELGVGVQYLLLNPIIY